MKRKDLKKALRLRKKIFGAWVSYSEPSIAETFAKADFDFLVIDMEHSSITLPQSKNIISVCQSMGLSCLPRPVSHSNDYFKPLLEFGSDGLFVQMVNNSSELKKIINYVKYPPIGNRSYGINRAQEYGFKIDEYFSSWNDESSLIIQIESIDGVNNIESLLDNDQVDAVMIGPYDISGSLGVPGEINHPKVINASKKVISACEKYGKSCGTQISDPNQENIKSLFDMGYTYAILGSDLFVLWKWAEKMNKLMNRIKN